MHRLIYRSESVIIGRAGDIVAEVRGIAERAAVANAAVDVTGALMLSAGQFFQVLEGPTAAVEGVFERICCDRRHVRLQLLEFAPIPERVFGGWEMALVARPEAMLADVAQLRLVDGATPAAADVVAIMLAGLRDRMGAAAPPRLRAPG